MNADTLLEHLRNGATLFSAWKSISYGQRPKYEYWLKLPDETRLQLQASTLKPLFKRRLLYTNPWIGGYREYHLIEDGKL